MLVMGEYLPALTPELCQIRCPATRRRRGCDSPPAVLEVLRTNEGDQPRLAGLAATPSTLYRVTFDLKAGYTFDDIAVQRLDELRWERP